MSRALLRRLAPPLLRVARAVGLGPLPFVPQGALHAPQPPARTDRGGTIAGWAAPAQATGKAPAKALGRGADRGGKGGTSNGSAAQPTRIGLFWNGTLVAETLADRLRPDVHALGLAPEACGFVVSYPADVDVSEAPLILVRLDDRLTPLACWPPAPIRYRPRSLPPLGAAPPADPMDRLRPLLSRAAGVLTPETAPPPRLTPRQRRLLAPDAGGRTAYLAHALLPDVPDDAGDTVAAYLAGYARDRATQGLAAPLAARDIAHLRASAPAGTDALCRWLVHGPGALVPEVFADPDTDTGKAANGAGTGLDTASDRYADLAAPATPGPWTLSRFALWLLADRPAMACVLDPACADHRRLWALALCVEGGHGAALLPRGTRTAALAELPAFCAALTGTAPAPSPPRPILSAAGHRLALPALSGLNRPDTPLRSDSAGSPSGPLSDTVVDVQVVGPFSRASGLGQAARATAAALATTGLTLRLVDAVRDHPTPGGAADGLALAPPGRARVTLLHQNLEAIPATLAYGPDPDGALIGFGFWELDRPPADHALGLALVDRLWAASPFGRDIYADLPADWPDAPPIDVAPLPVLLPAALPSRTEARARLSARLGHALDTEAGGICVFFASFDSYSFIARKNPQAVVRAFADAFGDRTDVRLVLKTHNRAAIGDPAQVGPWQTLMRAVAADPRITMIDETLPFADLLALKAGADAYVSLHRAEGWGFGLIEAMALGLPVVATAWSGNLAFMDDTNAHLVPATLVPVTPGTYLRVPGGAHWAEPDAAAAARALIRIADAPVEARALGAAARAHVDAQFSPTAVGAGHLARLAPLLDTPHPPPRSRQHGPKR